MIHDFQYWFAAWAFNEFALGGGNLDAINTQPAQQLDRVQFVVHRSMYDPGKWDASADVYFDLSKAVRVDLQHHYSGPICALNWITLCRQPEYGHLDLVDFIDGALPGALKSFRAKNPRINRMDLVSLGPGDGEIDIRLLRNIEEHFELPCYYCLDFSFDLLREAVSRVLEAPSLKNAFRIKAICGDFAEIAGLIRSNDRDETAGLFSLTGFTLGNYSEAKLLQHIAAAMSPSDVLFLDCHLHNLSDWDGLRTLSPHETSSLFAGYSQSLTNRFVFGPVETATLARFTDVLFACETDRKVTTVPHAFNVIIYCRELQTRMRFTDEIVQRDRLDLACTTFYDYGKLLDWFPTVGFQPIWQCSNGSIGLFLLERG